MVWACFLLAATYCIVIFALMLLSLLETILVTYLMDKASQEKLQDSPEKGDLDDCRGGEDSSIRFYSVMGTNETASC